MPSAVGFAEVPWYIAEKRGKVAAIEDAPLKAIVTELETAKAKIRARVEHPFRVVKRQFGYVKVRSFTARK